MPKLTTQAAKRSLLRRVRKQRLNYVTVLPSLITMLNGVFGFAAIAMASRGTERVVGPMSGFALAGYMVLLAMIADMLDGRLARMSHNTSSFGGQLDSLCDMISFGVAPAFLALKILEYKIGAGQPSGYMQRFLWLAAAAYVCCTAIRLARFNVENEEDESAHMSFIGLPSPAAAGVIVSLVIFHQEILAELAEANPTLAGFLDGAIVYAMPFVTLGIGLLMVSRIRYAHILNQYMKGKKPFWYLLWSLLVVGLVIWVRQLALVAGFCGFAASGSAMWIYCLIRSKVNLTADSDQPEIATEHGSGQNQP